MLTYLHDIRNKLTLISGHTAILANKYGEEDFLPIRTNLVRISELINDAYRHLKEGMSEHKLHLSPHEFVKQLDLFTETIEILFPLEIKNEVLDYRPKNTFNIDFHINQVFQVIENAVDNSVKANSSKVIIRLVETVSHCVYEIIDNGTGKVETSYIEDASIIPHGIGKEIMMRNMELVQGKVEWAQRLDQKGMIVRLYFPKKA